jgi:hypothetical protein
MKKYLTFISLLSFCWLHAQITVTQNDFADAGDKVAMSAAVVNQFIDYSTTGPNTTWDYSSLQYNGQRIDTFFTEYSSVYYALYFSNVSINSHRSNIATHGPDPAPILPILPVSNTINYFYKNSSQYVQQGFGAQIAGIPAPVPYSHKDVLYNFPLNYNDADNSTSGYSIKIPTLGYYEYLQTRTNQVDGWGTVITPYDTFQALRVFTEIASSDSFYIDTVHFGFKIPHLTQHQYKWIANGQKEPVLQINTQVLIGSIEAISSIYYRDSIHPVISGVQEIVPDGLAFNLYPNPANDRFAIVCPADITHAMLTVIDITGKTIMTRQMGGNIETIDASGWSKGSYFVVIYNGEQKHVKQLVIQ